MTNHVHILTTPSDQEGLGRMLQYVGMRYVPYINRHYGTSGTLWEGRYKASLIQEENYLLTCMRYIEMNPVRANMVAHPRQYRWSSYRTNGEGREAPQSPPTHSILPWVNRQASARQPTVRVY